MNDGSARRKMTYMSGTVHRTEVQQLEVNTDVERELSQAGLNRRKVSVDDR